VVLTNSSPLRAHAVTEAILPQPLQLEEMIREKAKDTTCPELTDLRGPDTVFDVNEAGLLVRKAPLNGSEQIVIPNAPQPQILHLEHCNRKGHPGIKKMVQSLRRRYFWTSMVADVAKTVENCTACAKSRIHERKRTSFLKRCGIPDRRQSKLRKIHVFARHSAWRSGNH
jgi:hypothetical protein